MKLAQKNVLINIFQEYIKIKKIKNGIKNIMQIKSITPSLKEGA
jgi:hypothetical protein